MEVLNLIPKEDLFYAVLGVFLPAIAGLLVYLKTEKDKLIEFVVDEVDDVYGDLTEAVKFLIAANDYLTDAVEFTLDALKEESEDGIKLSEAEKAEALAQVMKAVEAGKSAIAKVKEAIIIGDEE